MQKIAFIIVCFLTAFILSCGSSGTDEKSCLTSFDCPNGKICSDGTCVAEDPSEAVSDGEVNDNDGSDVPDGDTSLPNGNGTDSDTATSDTHNDSDSNTPDTPNDNDTDATETPDTPNNDDDADTPETPDTPNDNDTDATETPDTTNDNDADTPETPDTPNDNDAETIDDADSASDDDADTDDSDTEINEGDPYSDWDSSPDDEVCPFVMNECINPVTDFGCLPAMASEADSGLCDGLDNDCDGIIDEGCGCKPGETQACFKGKPNQRNVGKCQDGVQTCINNGTWGVCEGGISPKQDICDNADNDCNGCVDDDLCCNPPINCAYDIGTAQPFTDKIINGNQIYDTSHLFNDAATATWTWTLTKGPCDIVLNKTSFAVKGATTEAGLTGDGAETTIVSGTGLSWFKVRFRLSGSYTLHLKVKRTNGEVYECEWIIRVLSDGLRIELCWDKTGSHDSGGYDLDLHMGKNGVTQYEEVEEDDGCDTYTTIYPWGAGSACFYGNCRNNDEWNVVGWGYADTASGKNPRLDIDNIRTAGEPENINLDNPKNSDTFRVLVHTYPWDDYSSSTGTHPVVNVYCGGTLKATYGVSPQYTLKNNNDSWKVVEIKWIGDVTSDACELTPNLGIVSGEVPNYNNW